MKLSIYEKEMLLSSLYSLRLKNYNRYLECLKQNLNADKIHTRLNKIDKLILKVIRSKQ